MLLIDPSNSSDETTTYSSTLPHASGSSSIWNVGSNSDFGASGALAYADGTPDPGLTVNMNSLSTEGLSADYDFPGSVAVAGVNGTNLFSTRPAGGGAWGPSVANVGYGGVGMKISGLASGTYDIYITGSYVGSSTSDWAGGSTPAEMDIWALSSASGISTIEAGTYGVAIAHLTNATSASWIENNNYAKITVTLKARPRIFSSSPKAPTARIISAPG